MIVTSNKPFSAWGEIFGDEFVATAMIDRLVHHAEILSLKDSSRLRGKTSTPARRPAGLKSPGPSVAESRARASQRLPEPCFRSARPGSPDSAPRRPDQRALSQRHRARDGL
jgi:IstB-like ATP binding protein